MKYLTHQILFFCFLLTIVSCDSTSKLAKTPEMEKETVEVVEEVLDTVSVVASREVEEVDYSLPKYNPSFTRAFDLIHTKLDLSFDWPKEHVLGTAWLTMKPLFYEQDMVHLDAKGFDFHSITMKGNSSQLKYENDGAKVHINLGKTVTRNQEITLEIKYTAKPSEEGGSAAITSDKGLFFINPRGEEDKPQQIWTQGETENNSRWFPTFDKPNERCTQELTLTVDDKFETLSNGILVSSTKNSDGTRTDYWKMDLPHAPYLFMIAVGEFAVVKDRWEGIDVGYYVEPEYKDYARNIFAHTPEMLTYFSSITGVKYPWPKYSQVIVRDFVSGAMENTTGVIFGDFVQKTDNELIDNSNDFIVAHELFHHWFGDYVTCESWANLTLNEGFANYSEYLWFENKYGKDAADHHRVNELNGYLGSAAQQGVHPLIHFSYDDKEQMFDAHSYNKGGLVLHMLRGYIGDEAFFAGFKKYLEDNAYTAVEADELRMAYEDVTGQDMNWFFDQWFFGAGHPDLEVSHSYDAASKMVKFNIEQKQDPEDNVPVFIVPMPVDIYDNNGVATRHELFINERSQEIELPFGTEPSLVVLDPDGIVLFTKKHERSSKEYAMQYDKSSQYLARREAVRNIKGDGDQALFAKALNDPHWSLRSIALEKINTADNPSAVNTIINLAEMDKHSRVRSSALNVISEIGNASHLPLIERILKKDPVDNVKGAALGALTKIDLPKALVAAKSLENSSSGSILGKVADIYASTGDSKYMGFFEKNLNALNGWNLINFYGSYGKLLSNLDPVAMLSKLNSFKSISTDMSQAPIRRFASTRMISDISKALSSKEGSEDTVNTLKSMITEIKGAETNEQLKAMYGSF